jgi:nucleoside-diphosphate-sugar epimerase
MSTRKTCEVLVCGAGGFIGGWLVAGLRTAGGLSIRAVDVKPLEQWYQRFEDVENLTLDLQDRSACEQAVAGGVREVYNLAADMGGIGFIEHNKALCMLSVLINTYLLMASHKAGAQKYLFASSACVYAADKQTDPNVTALKEEDAYPASPEDGYGWEKLFSERMCRHFREDFGLHTCVARYHNVYGPHGTFDGGREKAPAAICRKVILAKLCGKKEIEIWGDGHQTRSFIYIEDCIKGTRLMVDRDIPGPLNIGSNKLYQLTNWWILWKRSPA